MIVKDWIKESSEEIASFTGYPLSADEIYEIISRRCPMKIDTAYVELGESKRLASLLIESKRDHYHCEDSWFCCGKCRHPDHGLEHGDEWLGSHRDRQGGVCDCGDDAWNKRVDDAVKDYVSIG